MKKKLLSFLFALSLLGNQIAPAYAAAPKFLFKIDCNTLNKRVQVGFQSDPDAPNNGPEIIAFEMTLKLEPQSGSTLADLSAAKFEPNTAYTNMIIAQNTSKEVNGYRELKIAGGFTQQQGVNNVPDLLSIAGIQQKPYKISVLDGKLFPKDGGDDIYNESPQQSFVAEPSSCQQTTSGDTSNQNTSAKQVVIENFTFTPDTIKIKVGETVTWTNNDTTAHTVTSVNAGPLQSGNIQAGAKYSKTFSEKGTYEYQCTIHPSMKGRVVVEEVTQQTTGTTGDTSGTNQTSENTQNTTIEISSDKQQANPGDEVTVTAIISNLSGSIDWSQTSGTKIQPDIQNEAMPDNKTKSELIFTMPTPATDIVLRVKVGDATGTITIKGTDTANTGSAPTNENNQETTTGTTDSQTLQERLQQRREELQGQANPTQVQQPTGTVHSAAGTDLTRTGPEHTALGLVLISAGIVYLSRKKKQFVVRSE